WWGLVGGESWGGYVSLAGEKKNSSNAWGARGGSGLVPREEPIFTGKRSARRKAPRGGLFGFKFSSRRHPRKFGVKRFLVVKEVAGAVSGVACFWLPPWKKFSAA